MAMKRARFSSPASSHASAATRKLSSDGFASAYSACSRVVCGSRRRMSPPSERVVAGGLVTTTIDGDNGSAGEPGGADALLLADEGVDLRVVGELRRERRAVVEEDVQDAA